MFAISGNPLLFNSALNGIYTANGAIYGDLHVADWHVCERAIYHVPATCNNLGEGSGMENRGKPETI